ncbi:Di-copper centre-containing protein [Cylindrobasidium torrendii FP15055 ss-10]|uniref:tyrosinase n=1 Tax=Cylindrobasidium torrendii FP15055 ss-10 TaxID=1314674 RepID=A0A0D7BEH6_9AGAR|nr:Di-copper centre-containing protein [Cylindrobasidium torrendii FP15055 ss-10]
MPPTLIITGATGGDPPSTKALAPNRLNIYDFVKPENNKQFSLYILALERIMDKGQDEVESFFAVGGIHGLPYKAWNGSGEEVKGSKESVPWRGYCSHGTVLFPTFHRPYVFLFEQLLQAEAKAIAEEYPLELREAYKKAAMELRQPFWDWARVNQSVPPPEVIELEEVKIVGTDGKETTRKNPLRRYKFNPVDPSFPGNYRWPTTVRRPTRDGQDNVTGLTQILNRNSNATRTKTFHMLMYAKDWLSMSNHTPNPGRPATVSSLESIHDSIHDYVGGEGHMGNPIVAGFDPIFMLHHANVDRILSLWSALHPGLWVTPGDSERGTWTIPADSKVDENTDLTPFWNSSTGYWKSTAVTKAHDAGYTYPEFNDVDMNNTDEVRTVITDTVETLYGSKALNVTSNFPAEARTVSNNPEMWNWTVRVQVKQYALEGSSFSVLLFLRTVEDSYPEEEDWYEEPNYYIGSVDAFVNSLSERCANCTEHRDAMIEGFVHLNECIAARAQFASFDPSEVEPYLKENLVWRLQKANGEIVEPADVESLEVTVLATRLQLPWGARMPIPEEEAVYFDDITRGRAGGTK